jgi:5-aminopentanamidase
MAGNGQRRKLRVGAAQFDAVAGDLPGNTAAHVRLIDEAGEQGVDVLIFPELSLPGYASMLLTEAPERCVTDLAGPALKPIKEACRRNSLVAVVGGCLPNSRGLGLSALVIDRQGTVCATYDKQYLDSREKDWFVPGQSGCIIEVDGWHLALGICYDSSFPEHGRAAVVAGADAYLVGGAFPLGRSDHRRTIYFPARALENTMYVAFANYVGGHDGLDYGGCSVLYGPDGGKLDEVSADTTTIAMTDLDAEFLRRTRETLEMVRDRRAEPAPVVTSLAS